MSIPEFIFLIKRFIDNGDLESALDTMGEMFNTINKPDSERKYRILRFQYSCLNKQVFILTHERFELRSTQIAYGLLRICDQIDS